MKKTLLTLALTFAGFSAFAQTQDWTITNPDYDAPDIGVATYDVTQHGVANDGITNNTSVIKDLLAELGRQGGGILYFPAGKYIISSPLTMPRGVSIRGDWKKPVDGKSVDGTVLMCTFGKNADSRMISYAMITMAPSTSVSNVAIWYPDQDPNDVSLYPWTIIFGGVSGEWGNEYCHVRNVTFVNSYNAILHNRSAGGGATNVHNVYGTVFNRGIEIDNVSEVCRFDYIHWSPKYWAESGLTGAPASTSAAYSQFMKKNAIGVEMKRNDWSYTSFYEAESLKIGFHAVVSAEKEKNTPNGHNYGFIFRNCGTGVQCDDISGFGIMFTDVTTENCQRGLVVNSTESAPVQVSNCHFAADTAILLSKTAFSKLMAYQTTVESGRVIIQNSDFTSVDGDYNNAIPQIELSKDCRAIITGNRSNGEEMQNSDIKNGSFYECDIDNTPIAGLKTPPTFTWEDCFDVPTKPAKNDVFVVTKNPYNVEKIDILAGGNYKITFPYHDGETIRDSVRTLQDYEANRPIIREAFNNALAYVPDATATIQTALDDAFANGGGIVYLPAGHYKVLGTLTIPTGVELKGANDIGTHPMGAGSVLEAFAGKDDPTSAPFITMEANSGIRGIVIHYPEQDAFETEDFRHVYPYTIRGNANTYIVNVTVQGCYNAIDLFTEKCDNHFIDYFAGQPFKNTVRVGGGSVGGKIYNIQTNLISFVSGNEWKFGTWTNAPRRDNGTTTENIKNAVKNYISEQHDFMILGDCSDQILYNNFGYLAQHGVWFKGDEGNGPSGKCLGQGIDAGTISLYYEKLGTGGFDMINTQIVVLQNGSQANKDKSAYIQTAADFTGEANLFSSDYWGGPKTGIIASGGTLNLYTAHHAQSMMLRNLKLENDGKVNFINSNIGKLSLNNSSVASKVGVSYSFAETASSTTEGSYSKWVYNLSGSTKNPSTTPPIMDRTGWIAYASENNGAKAQESIDGINSTYWISTTSQTVNHWYYVDMREQNKFNTIYISSNSNYISKFDVLISDDGEEWTTIATNKSGSNLIVLELPYGYTAQYIKIQSAGVAGNKWAIYEFGIAYDETVPDYVPPTGVLNNYADNTQASIYYENGTLQISGIENGEYQLTLYNIAGQQITNKTATSNIVTVGNLKSGIYILTVKQNGKYYSGKFFAK
ncbi:MAG: discoidin domain-containing protein [Prevotellaceae bacterium]|jgi:hypothetical protein|nr:discoidin domain-containing protein [Prevotellaceae bacterium]